MVRKTFTAISIALLIALPLIASDGYIYPETSRVYDDMERLYILEGYSGTHSSKPWSQGEVRKMLDRLDEKSLDGLSAKLYGRIKETIREDDHLSFSLKISPEIYAHTAEDTFVTPEYWDYGFEKRLPFATAGADASIGPFSTHTELSYGWGRITHKDEFRDYEGGIGAIVPEGEKISILERSDVYSRPFLFNFPDITQLYLQTPGRTAISLGWKNFLVSYQKDALSPGKCILLV